MTWTPTYDVDNAQILQAANSFTNTWAVTSIFSPSEGDSLSGTNYVTQSLFGGGINDQFVTSGGDVRWRRGSRRPTSPVSTRSRRWLICRTPVSTARWTSAC